MNSVSQPVLLFLNRVAWAGFVVALLVTGWLCWRWMQLPSPSDSGTIESGPVPQRLEVPLASSRGSAFYAPGEAANMSVSFDDQFRLAGTFCIREDLSEQRRAIIEVLANQSQVIVSAGAELDGVRVLSVKTDRVALRGPAGRGELLLSFTGGPSASVAASDGGGSVDGPLSGFGGTAGRFGKQVSSNMWVFTRSSLESYYNELLENPDRLLSVFDSLKPLRDVDDKITGYTLGIEGEADFFNAVGMEEGDVVRTVNGIDMTNRRRAEYLIRQFSESKLNAFAIDIERDGANRRLVYSVR